MTDMLADDTLKSDPIHAVMVQLEILRNRMAVRVESGKENVAIGQIFARDIVQDCERAISALAYAAQLRDTMTDALSHLGEAADKMHVFGCNYAEGSPERTAAFERRDRFQAFVEKARAIQPGGRISPVGRSRALYAAARLMDIEGTVIPTPAPDSLPWLAFVVARALTDVPNREVVIDECADAVQLSGWAHAGEDAYSQGMDAGARHQVTETLKMVTALKAGKSELTRDAERWRALMSSQRLHFMGCSGFTIKGPPHPNGGVKAETVEPKPNHQLHFGMEFWDVHSAHGDPEFPDTFERHFMLAYVDELVRRRLRQMPVPSRALEHQP